MNALADFGLLWDQSFAVVMGLGLAATCGLRAFLPLLVISLLAMTGKAELGASFVWMGTPTALICFTTAVVAETAGDKIPMIDHALDSAGVLIKPTAAAVAAASMVTSFDPLLALVLGLVSGGVAAETVHAGKAKLRLASSAFTGTLANPVLSIAEDLLALASVAALVLAPILGLAALFIAAAGIFGVFALLRRFRRSRLAAAA